MAPEDNRELVHYKTECLFEEHRTLSSFVEKEVTATAITRCWCATVWLFAAALLANGLLTKLAVVLGVGAFWLVDVFYSYTGVIYKMRRLQVRVWLHDVPTASSETVAQWHTPANPFDGLSRNDKIGALRDTALSPPVSAVYALLILATLIVL